MSRIIFLDSGPLGFAATPDVNAEHLHCSQWLDALIRKGNLFAVAEIVDYECRRGWLRHDRTDAIARLDDFKRALIYVPLTTAAMLQAAAFWAASRKGGYPTTDDRRLDADVILAAQMSTFAAGSAEILTATDNVRHLSRFVTAKRWQDIPGDP
jgi:predicted nucleic acid-binding protein